MSTTALTQTGTDQEPALLIIDACSLINLTATGRLQEILGDLPFQFAAARYVIEKETLRVGGGENATETQSRLEKLANNGILGILDVSSPEESADVVRFASCLDDGEAYTAALARSRGAAVVTDDKKALREIAAAGIDTVRTSELLFPWTEIRRLTSQEIVTVLQDIENRACFRPPRDDPYYRCWADLVSDG